MRRPDTVAHTVDTSTNLSFISTDAANAFLETDELEGDVWQSYGDTIRKHGIHAIPLFIFHHVSSGAVGGPFRAKGAAAAAAVTVGPDGVETETETETETAAAAAAAAAIMGGTMGRREPWTVNGSANAEHFFEIFSEVRWPRDTSRDDRMGTAKTYL